MLKSFRQAPHLVLLLLSGYFYGCTYNPSFFELVPASRSNIRFINQITENDSINQLDNGNVLNGSGVGIGDFNNDGLQDIFFTASMTTCKLYLNRGNFRFTDVTAEAGVTGEGKWCSGISVVDINNDGWLDLHVSATMYNQSGRRKNLLYINQGTVRKNVPRFVNLAAEYGLDDDSHTTQAAFFDYDNDGDLDVYLTVNEVNDRNSPYIFHKVVRDGSNPCTGKLYRNDWNEELKHPVFTNVSEEAGLGMEGYGNQATIVDVNRDGWKDIYVSNDYLSNDLMWINNGDGTFREQLSRLFKHTSNSAMGNDAGDINNDGLIDFITLDMNPEDNYRKKMMLPPASYQFYQNSDKFGYNYQYTRNTLQLNQGFPPGNDSLPVFSEIAYFSGIEATDWSWTPLLCDADNDGYRDLFIANGFPRDITDRDFMTFRSNAWATTPKKELLKQVPEVKLHNYIFRNNGDLTFSDFSDRWGMDQPTFSNGAACADLDNDGDLDLVVNNINQEASVYRNNARELAPQTSNFLRIIPEGGPQNANGYGAVLEIHVGGKMQVCDFSPYRGYLSSSENMVHFGLGACSLVDSLVVKWPGGSVEVLKNISANQVLNVNLNNAVKKEPGEIRKSGKKPLLREVTPELKISFSPEDPDFIDFNIQKLMPRKYSEQGPYVAGGDLNGDGLDDFVAGGPSGTIAQLFFQNREGTFRQEPLSKRVKTKEKTWDDAGIALFDAEGDGDPDLYIASGGFEHEAQSVYYADHFYLNDGKGNFTDNSVSIPVNHTSKGCVLTTDFDRDGDPDLFVSGRVDPWYYPRPVSSFLYRNDSGKGRVKFTDVTREVAPDLLNIGMVAGAVAEDFNQDGLIDLILAGEWMPVTFLANRGGKFEKMTGTPPAQHPSGWWTSLASGDVDRDGDVDFVAGNLGLNSFYRAAPGRPVSVVASDFDNNGSYDAFPALYLKTSQADSAYRNFPAHGRDDLVKQMIRMRNKFQNYRTLAGSAIDQLFEPGQFEKAQKVEAAEFRSSFIRNDGNGKFTFLPLPAEAQFSVVQSIIIRDFNHDGNDDVLLSGNDFGTDVLIGRYDALNGLLLTGDGQGNFKALAPAESGFFVPGNGRHMTSLRNKKGEWLTVVTEHNGPLRVFRQHTGI